MNARRLIIALVFSLAGSAIFTVWLSKKFAKPVAQTTGEIHYVAAAQDLQAGDVLSPGMLKLVPWPSSSPLNGAFPKPDALNGRIVLFPLSAGEPIIERQLAAAGSAPGLSMKIPDGMRAISLRSDAVVGVAGFLLPGTHVDVLVTYRSPNSSESITATVLQDTQVIATGQKMEPDPGGKPTTTDVVTLLVNPQDAEKAVEASSQGSVHFVLRNGSDHQQLSSDPVQLSQLGSVPAPPTHAAVTLPHLPHAAKPVTTAATAAPAPKPYAVEVIYGDKTAPENVK
jgi:pilus assembly protein CpaB